MRARTRVSVREGEEVKYGDRVSEHVSKIFNSIMMQVLLWSHGRVRGGRLVWWFCENSLAGKHREKARQTQSTSGVRKDFLWGLANDCDQNY